MEIRILDKSEARKPGDVRILPLLEGSMVGATPEEEKILLTLGKEKIFRSKPSERYVTQIMENRVYQKVVFVGVKPDDLVSFALAVGAGVKEAKKNKARSVEIILAGALASLSHAERAARACVLADYVFDKYKHPEEEDAISHLEMVKLVVDSPLQGAGEAVQRAMVVAEAINLARDLVNEPANHLGPEELAQAARTLADPYEELEVEILQERKIEALGMEAFLAVAGASKRPPRFIILRYRGNPDLETFQLGIAGKGITYDTGGLSIKSNEGMLTMKTDMGGAAATMATLEALARNRVKVNVVGVVAACENAVGDGNYRPGDILGSMKKKSIYVANTDAEGRLTLADAVTYLDQVEKVERIVDIATLTGAAEVALGQTVMAALSTDDDFFALAQKAMDETGEKLWRLPAFEEYKELIKTEEADLSNSGGRYAGAITAGLFVGEFTGGRPWIHLDIAGPSYTEKPNALQQKGATGSGVDILYHVAASLA